MEIVAFAAGMATVLSAFQLLPQLARSMRLSSTAGLSPIWASIGVVINVGWGAYRWSQELWLSLLSPIIAAGLYVALLWLVLHSIPQRRGTYLAIAGASSTIGIAGLLGGWQLVGTALGLWAGVQIAPAVWSAFRTKGQLAIAPGLWMVGLGQALLWGYYGHAVGDGALVIYGVAMGTGSAAILVRFATIRVRLRGQGETTKTMTSSQPGVAAVLMKDPAEAF